MSTLITVLKGGGRYDARWVERLARGVRCHAPAFTRILCLTDGPLAVDGVARVPLRHDWPAWWAKMEAFRPGLSEGTTLLCDLDTVFTGRGRAGPPARSDRRLAPHRRRPGAMRTGRAVQAPAQAAWTEPRAVSGLASPMKITTGPCASRRGS